MYLGISAAKLEDNIVALAIAAHDGTYLVDFMVENLKPGDGKPDGPDVIADHVLSVVQKFEREHFVKFIGAGLPTTLLPMSSTLSSRLWLEVDIVPIVIHPHKDSDEPSFWDAKHVDEQADSMARKCIM